MKNLLTILLVLAMASAASAATAWLEVDPQDVEDSYYPSDVITINLVANGNATSLQLGAVTSDTGGTASNPVLSAALPVLPVPGTVVNGAVLVEIISGGAPFGFSVAAGAPIWSFDYHVPQVPESTIITIDDLVDMAHQPMPYMTSISFDDWSSTTAIGPLQIHVMPEPMTIALLGLGGLFLRRRR